MRCHACQTRLPADATQCDCGELVKVIPQAVRPLPVGLDRARPIEFLGDGATLFGMHLLYLAMTAVTVGIYHFWSKVKVRQYVYSMTRFEGDRFAYHGLGQELLLGWLKVAGIFGACLGVGLFLQFGMHVTEGSVIGEALAAVVAFLLLPVAIAGSQRYRLSRTSWRGVRFSFRGSTRAFWGRWIGWSALTTVTLGLAYPFFMNDVRRFIVDNSWFGNKHFSYSGNGKDLFFPFALMVVGFLPTFGLSFFGYKAFRERYYWSHTHFEGATFECSVTWNGLFGLWITNAALMAVTFWMARPWAQVRSLHYLAANLKLVGPLDVDRVEQEIQQAGVAGEGLTEFVETGFFDVELGL